MNANKKQLGRLFYGDNLKQRKIFAPIRVDYQPLAKEAKAKGRKIEEIALERLSKNESLVDEEF